MTIIIIIIELRDKQFSYLYCLKGGKEKKVLFLIFYFPFGTWLVIKCTEFSFIARNSYKSVNKLS